MSATAPIIETGTPPELPGAVKDLVTFCEDLAVETYEQAQDAAARLADVKALRKQIEETYGPRISQAHKLHKGLVADRKRFDAPLQRIEIGLKTKIADYQDREERRRQIEAAQAAEAQRKADEEARLEEAAALEAAGETEAAEAILNEEPLPPPVTAEAPKVGGVSTRRPWKAEVVDVDELIAAAGRGEPLALAILKDEKVVAAASSRASAMARGLGGDLKVPGVRVWQDRVIAAGSR